MEFCEKKLNNFKVIFSEQLTNQIQTTFSSCSSKSSNSSYIDTVANSTPIENPNTVISPIDVSLSELSLKLSKNTDERKKELNKKKEEKLILKYKKEEAAKLQAVARSKCGRYIKYDCKIGEGGYKIVSKGFDKEACCSIAWCEVKREHLDSKEKNHSMLKEIEIMLKLDHPNVVKCHAVLKDWWLIRDDINDKKSEGKGLVIIQELMGAGTLKEMIKKNFQDGRCILETRLITSWLYQIIDVLRYMHCRIDPPIIHRDVKSENCFLVEQAGEDFVSVKIGDFGLATTINQNSHRKTMIGTVGFMAPEVFEENYDNKVDIYAFGMMVLEVMTNKTPYDDCKNVFQVVSKSMGSHLPYVISTITQPLMREIILACVHPVPTYRPSAEELCEHAIFQNCPLTVEPNIDCCSRSEAIEEIIRQLSFTDKLPLIELKIDINFDFAQQHSSKLVYDAVVFSLDVYQAQNSDLSELMAALKPHIDKEYTIKKLNGSKNLCESVRLQIQYLIKLINGERWRHIFNDLLLKETEERRNHRSNSTPSQRDALLDAGKTIPSKSLNLTSVDKYTNNFTEYTNNVAIYHKATESFEEEMEVYCCAVKNTQNSYFFNVSSRNGRLKRDETSMERKDPTEPLLSPQTLPVNVNALTNEPNVASKYDLGKGDSGVPGSPSTDTLSVHEDAFILPTNKDGKEVVKRFVRAEVYSSADSNVEDEAKQLVYNVRRDSYGDPTLNNSGLWVDQYNGGFVVESPGFYPQQYYNDHEKMNLMHNQHCADLNQSFGSDYYQYGYPHTSNAYFQVNQHYPTRNTSVVGSKSILEESHYSPVTYIDEQSRQEGYLFNYNLQPQAQFCYPPKFIYSSQNRLLPQNINCQYDAPFYSNQTDFSSADLKTIMQTNTPYQAPVEPNPRYPISMSQPVLTRSLPSIVGCVPAPFDNVIVSGICHSYVSMATNAAFSQSNVANSITFSNGTGNILQKTFPNPNCSQNQLFSQQFNLPVISSSKQAPSKPQSNHSNVVSSSKSLDKSRKKSKSRMKSKYLLKVINIQENFNPADTILTFEMMLPMHQMRFTCCLSNEFNSRDVSNSVGESGQIPGELGKKDILESLVNTVKKICRCLAEDIHSISLNEDFVFHPCLPNSGLIKLSDSGFSIPVSLDSDTNQTPPFSNNISQTSFPVLYNSCASSSSLSRHASYEDVSLSISTMSTSMSEKLSGNFTENDLIIFSENDTCKPTMTFNPEKPIAEIDTTTMLSKCSCPVNESSIKVPEYLYVTLKQVVDKLLNIHCKGLIILPSSNDILTRNFRILEIPADHMFVGLPGSDSSYNVIKGQKDKDFIIAKDNRDPDNVREKCVYQKPVEGAVLLDSSGEIHYIQKPSLIIPPKPGLGNEKSFVKELPPELTQHNDKIFDFDQMVALLQSLNQIQNASTKNKDELFDSPVLLEPTKVELAKPQDNITGKPDVTDNYPRRGSMDKVVPVTQPSQIQVERIFCQYVVMPKTSDINHCESSLISENIERDLPRQQVRSRKISNESLDSISSTRTRPISTVQYVLESEYGQQQPPYPNILPTSQMSLQNPPQYNQAFPLISPIPLQRLPNIPGSSSGSYMLSNQNPNNSMHGNMFIQNLQNVPIYTNSSQGSGTCVSYPHYHPSHGMSPGMVTNQINQVNPIQRMAVPSSTPSTVIGSSQFINSSQVFQPNLGPISQQGMSSPMHQSQIIQQAGQFSDQFSGHPSFGCESNDQSLSGLGRYMPLPNVRQLPQSIASSQVFDQNVFNSRMTENVRNQPMNPSSSAQSQSQTTPLICVPNRSMAPSSNICSTTVAITASKSNISSATKVSDSDSKQQKTEQTIGRFVVRPVTDGSANS